MPFHMTSLLSYISGFISISVKRLRDNKDNNRSIWPVNLTGQIWNMGMLDLM